MVSGVPSNNLEISKTTKGNSAGPRLLTYFTGHESSKTNLTRSARGYPTNRGEIHT